MRALIVVNVLNLMFVVTARSTDPATHESTPNVAAAGDLIIHADQPGIKINPMIFGLMTEEINHSY
ncbi:MAG TPA: hypothetical protein VHS31_14675, partial [Tepidisphaeraceae bacterium]|nr:hypothetical protein [Tepidisphaeraceae bacterium]